MILQGHASTPDELEIVSLFAADLDITVDYVTSDQPASATTMNPATAHLLMTTATTSVLLTGPAANKVHGVKSINIRNRDTTDSTQVTVQIDRNSVGTDVVQLHSAVLAPGDVLEWSDEHGWYKVAFSDPWTTYVRKSAQQTIATTTFQDINGMGFSVAANGVYEIEYDIIWRSATATVGVGAAVNGPASPTSVQGTVLIIGARGAGAFTDLYYAGFAAYDTPNITSTTTNATATDYGCRISCLLEVGGTSGTLIPRWRSETATNTTVEAGSFGTCKRLR